MSYEYPVWEFEQKFAASGGATPQQLVKERGIWRFVADPTAPAWFDPTIPNAGKVSVYINMSGEWVFVVDLLQGFFDAENVENAQFGKAFSILENGEGGVYAIIVSSNTRTFVIRTWSDIEFDQGFGVDDWFMQAFQFDELLINGAPVSGDIFIDQEGCVFIGGKKVVIPRFYGINPPPGHSNEITVQTLSVNNEPKYRCEMLWDGNYAWSFTNTSAYNGVSRLTICAIDTWHYDGSADFSTLEKLTYHYYFDNNTHSDVIRSNISAYVQTGSGGIQHDISATRYYENFYVAVGQKKIYVFDKTMTSTGIINMPEITTSVTELCSGPVENKEQQTIFSNIVCSNGNLFFTSFEKTASEQQRLWRYDLTAKTWTSTVIPGRHQNEKRHIVDGLDGSIWITNKNNHSVIRANNATGEILASIRINRHPYKLMANQSKEVFVASDAGSHKVTRKYYDPAIQGGLTGNNKGGSATNTAQMWKPVDTLDVTDGQISVIDQSDNSQDAYCAARCDSEDLTQKENGNFYDDGQGYLWFIAPDAMGRLRKSDKEFKLQFTQSEPMGDVEEDPGNEMIPDNSTIDYTFGNAIASIVTPIHTYQKWDGTQLVNTTVKPYLIWTTNGSSFNIVRLSALVRKSKYIHRATAMVATGDQAYIGG